VITALLHFLGLLPAAVFGALKWTAALLGVVLACFAELLMPTLLAGAAMAAVLAVTQFPAVRAAPVWGGLAVGVTTTAVLAGIVGWAHLAHGWWSR